jgi:hypothetical protein
MWYLYLDESGDLGFDFVNKRPSKYFVISILLIKNEIERKKISGGVKRTLRRKMNPKGKRNRLANELKGISTKLEVKKYFYRQIKDAEFSLFSIILNKRRVFDNLAKDQSRVYNWISRLLLDQIDFSAATDKIALVVDRCKGKKEIEDFNEYIRRQLESKIDPGVPLRIKHEDSCSDPGLSAADLFAWGILRKYERRDLDWYNVYKEKIEYETLYLP